MTGFVYFIQARGGGPIKIGYSANPEKRLAALQTASPYDLAILAIRPGSRDDEAALHDRLSAHRLRGDWFEDCDLVRQALPDAAQSGRARFVGLLINLIDGLQSALQHAESDRWLDAARDLERCGKLARDPVLLRVAA